MPTPPNSSLSASVLIAVMVTATLSAPALASPQSHVYDAGIAGQPAVPTSPEAQGWTLRSSGTNGLGPIVDDGGVNAWAIDDSTPQGTTQYAYYYSNSPAITNPEIGSKWELTITMKPIAAPDANFFIEVNSGFTLIHAGYRIFFRVAGNDVVIETAYGTALFTCVNAADGAYHTFSMRHFDLIPFGVVQVLYDGAVLGTATEDFPGGYAFDPGVKFGTWTNHGIAITRVHRVEFRQLDDLGVPRCGPAVPNSTGMSASLSASGSPYVNQNLLELSASDLPPNTFGYLITSQAPDLVVMAFGSQGNLCLGGSIGRLVQSVQSSGAAGAISIDVDLTALPGHPVTGAAPGDRWSFQLWYRDANPTTTSNFTEALDIDFR